MTAEQQAAMVKILITQKCTGIKCGACPFHNYNYTCNYADFKNKNKSLADIIGKLS
jgi:hypothetical protein